MDFNTHIQNTAIEFCDGLLDGLNSNDASVYAPHFAGQAARHNSIDTGRANTMDLAGVPGSFPGRCPFGRYMEMKFEIRTQA